MGDQMICSCKTPSVLLADIEINLRPRIKPLRTARNRCILLLEMDGPEASASELPTLHFPCSPAKASISHNSRDLLERKNSQIPEAPSTTLFLRGFEQPYSLLIRRGITKHPVGHGLNPRGCMWTIQSAPSLHLPSIAWQFDLVKGH